MTTKLGIWLNETEQSIMTVPLDNQTLPLLNSYNASLSMVDALRLFDEIHQAEDFRYYDEWLEELSTRTQCRACRRGLYPCFSRVSIEDAVGA